MSIKRVEACLHLLISFCAAAFLMSRRMFLPPVALKQLSEFLELRLEESVGFFYITGGIRSYMSSYWSRVSKSGVV